MGATLGFAGLKSGTDWQVANGLFVVGNLGKSHRHSTVRAFTDRASQPSTSPAHSTMPPSRRLSEISQKLIESEEQVLNGTKRQAVWIFLVKPLT